MQRKNSQLNMENKLLKFKIVWRSQLVSGNEKFAKLEARETPLVQCGGESIVSAKDGETAFKTWKANFPRDQIRIKQI